MTRIVLALAALLFFVPLAQAASFDCAKAATSFEKAICASPELSASDETLAVAYATALGGLSKAAADEVKATQHSWLDYAARSCGDDAQPIAGTYTSDQASCLNSVFRSRISDLESSRMQGGYRFFPIDRYLIEKDDQAAEGDFSKLASKQYVAVRIDGDADVARAFNAMVESMRSGYTELFKGGSDQIDAGDVTTDVAINTTVDSVSDYRISLVTDNYWFGHGAAHGNYGLSYNHFLVSEQRPLYASDIFSGKDWKAKLGKLVIAQLKTRLENGPWEESIKDIPKWSADPTRWNFSAEGLIIQFQPYEVASYAEGAVTVTLPWSELTDLLATDAEQIATY